MPSVGLAGDRVAGDDRDRQRQEQRQHDGERGERDEQPVAGDLAEEGRPVAAAAVRRCGHLDRDRDDDRDRGQHGEQGLLRRRPKTSRSSERRNRRPTGGRGSGRRRPTARPSQPLTSKPSPVSATNTSSRFGRVDGELRAPARRRAPAPAQTFSGSAAPSAAVTPPVRVDRPGADRAGQRSAAASPGRSVSTATRGCRLRAQLGERALGDQPADVHDADVRADLLDLGQQVGGEQHGGAVGGELAGPACAPRGCPAGPGRWSARPARAARAAAAAPRRCRAAAACPSE